MIRQAAIPRLRVADVALVAAFAVKLKLDINWRWHTYPKFVVLPFVSPCMILQHVDILLAASTAPQW